MAPMVDGLHQTWKQMNINKSTVAGFHCQYCTHCLLFTKMIQTYSFFDRHISPKHQSVYIKMQG